MKFKLIEEFSQNIINTAENWLKENCKASGFVERGLILTDGTTVDNTTYTGDPNDNRHSLIDIALQTYLMMKGFIKKIDKDNQFTDKLGFIRINGQNEDYICLPEKRITEAQINSLRNWIEDFFKRKRSLEVTAEFGDQATYVYPEDDAEYVIRKIRKYYNTGILEEDMKVIKESTRSHQNVARLTEEFDEYSFITYEDIISGEIGNMSEAELDKELKLFKRKAKALGLRRPEDLVIYIDEEDEFAPDWEYREEKIVDKNSKLYDADGIKVIYEIINGRSFLYFDSKENAKEYFGKFEQ